MIVYIITKLELGGAQKVCLSLMQGLSDNKIQVALISGDQGALANDVQKFKEIFLFSNFKREVRLFGFINDLQCFISMVRLLKKLKKQHNNLIVHTHSTKAGILGRWAAFFAGVPYRIHTIHGFGFNDYQSWPRWLIIYWCELVTSFITTHFICVSEKDRLTGTRLLPHFAKKSSLIRASIDWERFAHRPAPEHKIYQNNSYHIISKLDQEKPFIIGSVSCFKPQKNLFDALQAFKWVHDTLKRQKYPPPIFQIIGDGALREQLERWIIQHNMNHAIELLGWQHNVVEWMDQWDAFILSSLWEGLPCSIIEARLRKLPVVAYNIDGIPEVIAHGKNGFLVTPGNWVGLAHHLENIIKHPVLYQKLSGYEDQLDDFNNKVMVEKHLKLYSSWKSSSQ